MSRRTSAGLPDLPGRSAPEDVTALLAVLIERVLGAQDIGEAGEPVEVHLVQFCEHVQLGAEDGGLVWIGAQIRVPRGEPGEAGIRIPRGPFCALGRNGVSRDAQELRSGDD